jgi:hypothetical protein
MQFTTAIIKFEPISRNYKMLSFYTYIYIYIYGVPLLFWKYCTSVVLPGLALITNQSTNTVNTGWYYFPWYFHLVCIGRSSDLAFEPYCTYILQIKATRYTAKTHSGYESTSNNHFPRRCLGKYLVPWGQWKCYCSHSLSISV